MGKPVMIRVEWLEPARRQLQEIFDYYSLVADGKVAKKISGNIIEKARILIRNPRGGRREDLLEDQPEEFRRLVDGNYKIVYYIENDAVYISNVFDCRRDPEVLRTNVNKK